MPDRRESGRLTLTQRGFGFVQAGDTSILIPFDHLANALSGDTVVVEIFPDSTPDKPAGKIVSVTARNDAAIVGRVRRHGKDWRLYAQGNRSATPLVLRDGGLAVARADLADGAVVSARFDKWPADADHPVARLEELVCRSDDRELELRLITLSRGIPLSFPPEVVAHARTLKPIVTKRSNGRRDLTSLVTFTIDPATAKDLDDAMSIEQRADGLFSLGVHIADVSAYVAPDDPVDREAWQRGTSVYLVDTVVPMLPEEISNGLCSLSPDETKATMSVIATVDSSGTVHDVEVCDSLIRSRRRFAYEEAEAVLGGAPDPLARELHLLHLVAQSLRRRREARGSVDLDLPSPQIAVDEDGVPVSVRPSSRGSANRMVEECMLLANRLVAERLAADRSRPGVYRVHDAPRESDLDSLVETLNELGIPYQPDAEARTDDYRKILSLIQNFEFAELVESLAMKTLQKAVYSTENRGHFGLAMDAYTHFTSPIRRYPDLVVHRLLKESFARPAGGGKPRRGGLFSGKSAEKSADRSTGDLDRTCAHASERERLATDAEREYSRLKALEFLQTKKGREYSGMVTGVASIGLFVEIERYLIDGLVHISKLGRERFELDRPNHRLVGKSGTAFRIGDRVRVRVMAVDPAKRTADFELVKQ